MLKPTKKTGRTRASAMRASLIGGVAFTVKRLTETGMSAPTAYETVARILKAEGVMPARGGAGTITARTIRGWCEEVSVDVGLHNEAAQTYADLINDPRGTFTKGSPPEQARIILLDWLTATAKKIRAREGA